MADSWEDWENEDFEVPVLKTQEQLKRLEEKKLLEEDANALAKDLFQDEDDIEEIIKYVPLLINKPFKLVNNSKQNDEKEKEKPKAASKPEKAVNKQKENEEKQKELSKKLKEVKFQKERERELYGEADENDEYAKYEDQFY